MVCFQFRGVVNHILTLFINRCSTGGQHEAMSSATTAGNPAKDFLCSPGGCATNVKAGASDQVSHHKPKQLLVSVVITQYMCTHFQQIICQMSLIYMFLQTRHIWLHSLTTGSPITKMRICFPLVSLNLVTYLPFNNNSNNEKTKTSQKCQYVIELII